MKKHLKILSIIGGILIVFALSSSSNPLEYTGGTLGTIVLALYAWSKFKDRTIMLWISGLFGLWYTFGLWSPWDVLFWVMAFILIYKDEETKHKDTKTKSPTSF
jgi:hypothetical protein